MQGSEQARVDAVLRRALELSDEARERFLDETCSRDAGLRATVDRILKDCESDEPALAPGAGASGPLWQALARDYADSYLLEPGERLGAYRIERVVGHGGMATVYLARRADGQYEQTVALKVLDARRHSDALAVRFAQERQILATLEHPNIARLVDGGTTSAGRPYVVMEFVDGEPIDAWCDARRLTIEQRIEIFERVLDAVQYAHRHLIVHRDIKPSNILVTGDGQPKLLDFGIAKLLDEDMPHVAPETRDAVHPMTPEYASPEQLRGEPLTTAADVYQLGYLLYRLLTGYAPYRFEPQNVEDIVRVVCSVEPTRPSQVAAGANGIARRDAGSSAHTVARSTTPERMRRKLAGDLDTILLTALQKEPARRYASALHLHDDLRRHLDGLPIAARAPTAGYRFAKFVARHRAGMAAATLVLLAIVAGAAATAWQAGETAREAQRAEAVLEFLVGLFQSIDPNVTLGEEVTAKELLDLGAASLDEGLGDVPATRAEILGVVGRMYTDLGLYQDARPLLEEARASLGKAGPGGQRGFARSSDDLATVLYEQGEYEKAEAVAREALTARREDADTAAGDLSVSIGNLAATLSLQARFEDSHVLYEEALELDRLSDDPELLASHLSGYAASLYRAARYEEAQRVGEDALAIHRELLGPEHTLIATGLLNLGTAHLALGNYETAEHLLRECLEMRQKLLGDEHPHVAVAFSNLGQMLSQAGRLDEAAEAHGRALSIRRAVLGDAHPETANSLNHIGVNRYFTGRYAEAAETFEQVLRSWRESYGAHHPNVFSALNNLGAARREAGDYEGAETVLRETLALRREAFGDEHPQIAQSLNNLALVLARLGKNAEAEAMFREAVRAWQRTMGDEHPDVGDGLMSLGKFLLDQDRCAEAETPLRQSLAIREQSLDAEAPLLASSRMYLGECLVKLDEPAEAESLLSASLPVLVDRWGEDSPLTRRAQQALADARH